ncbi:MAG: hypothetical protein LBV30_09135 [Propionibacteriaceae bacterium]|jgi:hypothetical protein|nr:hypothetical protein [Propionibacteriaceae bacterium]
MVRQVGVAVLKRASEWVKNAARLPGRVAQLQSVFFPSPTDQPDDRHETGRSPLLERLDGLSDQANRLLDLADRGAESAWWAEFFSEVGAVNSAALMRRGAKPSLPYRVVFLVHHIGAWASIAPVIDVMRADPDFEVTVISIPANFRGQAIHGDDLISAELDRMGVAHLRLPYPNVHMSTRVIVGLQPDLIFRQSQWEDDVLSAFRSPALDFTRLALIPYTLVNMLCSPPGGVDSAFDSLLHRSAWRVYLPDQRALANDAEAAGADRSSHVITGHPKIEFLRRAEPTWPLPGPAKHRVLWSAHHSVDTGWVNFGLFPKTAPLMIGWARRHPDCQVVLMLHPLTRQVLADPDRSPIAPAKADQLFRQWDELANTAVYEGADYGGLFKSSDAMITDGISMLAEYQIASKPLIFTERADHRPFNDIGEMLMTGVHRHHDPLAALADLDACLAAGVDDQADEHAANIMSLSTFADAAERIAADVKAGLAAEAAAPADQPLRPPAVRARPAVAARS